MSPRRKITQPKKTTNQQQLDAINAKLVKLQTAVAKNHARLFRTTNKLRKLLFTQARLQSAKGALLNENN